VSTPPQYALSRLSRGLYGDFLAKARNHRFSFVRLQDFLPDAPALPPRYIALRHDVDFAPEYALEMAEIEHAAGVVSTYHVLVDGRFYNPLDPATIRRIREIHRLGHEIGLHFALDSAVDAGADAGTEVAFRLKILGDIVGAPVRSFSQHDPVNAGVAPVVLPTGHDACVNARQIIQDHDLLYVSDSAKMWRRHTFDSALDQGRNLLLLAHPHSWLHPEDDYVALIRDCEAQEVRRVSDGFDAFVDALPGYYEKRRREGL
jgi:hypothetical protein